MKITIQFPEVTIRGWHLSLGLIAIIAMILAVACGSRTPADAAQQDAVQRQQEQYNKTQPTPFFERSLERYLMTELFKARNTAVSTWSYTQSPYTGKLMWSCASIGYPIPGGTQLTNPEAMSGYSGSTVLALPQAEPNGLFSPDTSQGTWVMCLNDDGTIGPQYVEDSVHTAPYPLEEKDGQLVRVAGQKSTINIDPKQVTNLQPNATPIAPAKVSTLTSGR